jgi:DNA polymerase III subunit gamma/tau
MDKFIVSARKYRPQTFDTVIGQAHITTTLKNAIKNRQLAHAFLFCGPRGVGKTTCARILAKTINCENPGSDGEACNSCHSCVSFNEGTSLNIHELDAASNNSVDDIRSLVEQVRFAPQAGKYKVYIIDEVHMLSSSAFNAFLKTLEEPPPYAIFILATTEKHKILPTILSRCQIFDFKRITTNDTVEHLEEICEKEDIRAEKAALQTIAQKSEGCMRDALSIMDKIVSFTNGEVTYHNTLEHLNILDADNYFKLLECMQQQDLAGALLLYEDINRKGFEGDLVLNGFAEFIRNLLVSKDERVAELLDVVESFKERYNSVARKTNPAFLVSALNILNEAEINFRAARNKRLHVELTIIKLTYLQQALELSAGDDGVTKKKLIDTVKPVSFRNIPTHSNGNAKPKREERKTITPEEPKLIIQTEKASPKKAVEPANIVQPKIPAPTPQSYAETQVATTSVAVNPSMTETVRPSVSKVNTLEEIRRKFAASSNCDKEEMIPLSQEKLQQHWDEYTQRLREKKSPAVQPFVIASLQIITESSFEVVTNNNLEQKFIEQEKRELSEFLQKLFCNKSLFFSVTVAENPTIVEDGERPLNKKEQYQKIVEQYPLVKELRDRLRLELDY